MKFLDRKDAGIQLAKALKNYGEAPDTIILAMPRGGVPVAYEIAKALGLPMDLLLVRKLGVPGHEELAMGAISTGNTIVCNDDVIRDLNITKETIDKVVAEEHKELTRRNKAYRSNKPAPDLRGCTVILVDDGMATGANMRVAVMAVEKQHPSQIIIAVPVASYSAVKLLEDIVDEFICLSVPLPFYGVGGGYVNFGQTSDDEVKDLLKKINKNDKGDNDKRECA